MYIVIAGAGLVGQGLAQKLVENRHDVVVIDRDKATCESVAARTGALALCGGGTSIETIEEAGMTKADVGVATMRSDADNVTFALLARSFGVPQVIARMRDPRYENAYKMAGVKTTVRVIDLFVNQLLLEIEEPSLQPVASFGGGRAMIVVDTIPKEALVDGKMVSEIARNKDFPVECVIAGIYREKNQEFIIPRGTAVLRAGDRVFLSSDKRNLKRATKFLHRSH